MVHVQESFNKSLIVNVCFQNVLLRGEYLFMFMVVKDMLIYSPE